MKPKKEKRHLTPDQMITRVIIGIILFLLFMWKVFIPWTSQLIGQNIVDKFNKEYPDEKFTLVSAERVYLRHFYLTIQSGKHEDLLISSNLPPDEYTSQGISYLYEKHTTEKPITVQRFTMKTDDVLYDALKPVLGDQLLRVMGMLPPESGTELELDEPFQLGKIDGYAPTVDIAMPASDENYRAILDKVLPVLASQPFKARSLTITFTQDRKTGTSYSWYDLSQLADNKDAKIKEAIDLVRISKNRRIMDIFTGQYFDYPYNHDYTLPKPVK